MLRIASFLVLKNDLHKTWFKHKPMKKPLLFLSLLIYSIYANGRGDSVGWHHDTWAIKGKVLPWAAVAIPFEGINVTLGFEYGFRDINAIGIDLVYNESSSQNGYTDIHGDDSDGSNSYSISRGVFLYYRRYLHLEIASLPRPMRRLFKKNTLPYISPFARYGKGDWHYDPSFVTNNVSHDEWQYSAGALIGEVTGGLDINMGLFYKQTYISEVNKENGVSSLHNYMRPSWGFRVGVNLMLVLKVQNSRHYLAQYARDN